MSPCHSCQKTSKKKMEKPRRLNSIPALHQDPGKPTAKVPGQKLSEMALLPSAVNFRSLPGMEAGMWDA